MMSFVAAGFSGFLFALGLAVGGMTDPARVLGFLDVTGDWDPTLAFVMAGAMGTHAALRALVLRLPRPLLAPSFPSASRTRVDARLLVGSALFGAGWGLTGYCPGPAFVSVPTGTGAVLIFVAAMLVGMLLFQALSADPRARGVGSSADTPAGGNGAPASDRVVTPGRG